VVEVMRKCGDEVRELLHDGCTVACLGDAPFGYVDVFTSHVKTWGSFRSIGRGSEKAGGGGSIPSLGHHIFNHLRNTPKFVGAPSTLALAQAG
jgi:hypothetical protein